MSAEYRRYLIERFEGEIEGKAFFQGMSERAHDAELKKKWTLLAHLEAETAEHIGAALTELGVQPVSSSSCVERGQQLAEQFSRMPWAEFINVFRPALQRFVAEFSAAEQLVPAGSRERVLLRHITRHERALLAFAVRETGQGGEASVEAVRALLGKPLEKAAQ